MECGCGCIGTASRDGSALGGICLLQGLFHSARTYACHRDITATLRTGAPATATDGPQPSTCWTCKSPDVPRMMEAIGVDAFYNNKWGALGDEIVNPIGCADCHEPENMNLHISRPA